MFCFIKIYIYFLSVSDSRELKMERQVKKSVGIFDTSFSLLSISVLKLQMRLLTFAVVMKKL